MSWAFEMEKEVLVILLETVEFVWNGVSSFACVYARKYRYVLAGDFFLHDIAPVKSGIKRELISMLNLIN